MDIASIEIFTILGGRLTNDIIAFVKSPTARPVTKQSCRKRYVDHIFDICICFTLPAQKGFAGLLRQQKAFKC